MALTMNKQGAELERLRITCGVESAAVVPKAQEILRLMHVKCSAGSLGKGELCRKVIAFDLACRALDCPIPRSTAVKLSAAPEAVYASSLGIAQRLLGMRKRYTCEEVGKEVGGRRVGTMATAELKKYQERFLDSYPARQVASLDLDGTVYAVACFYLCARKLKHPVDKQRLLELAVVSEDEFNNVCRSMLDLCYSTLGVAVCDNPKLRGVKHHQNQHEKYAPLSQETDENTSNTAWQQPPSFTTASSTSSRGRVGKSTDGAADRRTDSLTRLVGAGDTPRNYLAAMAMNIRKAATRKRCGGATIAPVEPGDDRPSTYGDTTHHIGAKRPRLNMPAPPATRTTTPHPSAAAAAAAATSSTPFAPVRSPYASIGAGGVGRVENRHSSSLSVASKATGSKRTSSGRENAAVIASGGSSSSSGRAAWSLHGGVTVGRAAAGVVGSGAAGACGREGYAEWKSKALASMEKGVVNRLGGESSSSRKGVEQAAGTEQGVGGLILPRPPTGAGAASGRSTVADTAAGATPNKQSSLLSFFAPWADNH